MRYRSASIKNFRIFICFLIHLVAVVENSRFLCHFEWVVGHCVVRTVERNKEHNNLYPKQIITSEISSIHSKYFLFESLVGNTPQGRLVLEETHALLYGSLTLFIQRRHQYSLSRRAPREVPECKCSKYLEKLGSYEACYYFCYHICTRIFPCTCFSTAMKVPWTSIRCTAK